MTLSFGGLAHAENCLEKAVTVVKHTKASICKVNAGTAFQSLNISCDGTDLANKFKDENATSLCAFSGTPGYFAVSADDGDASTAIGKAMMEAGLKLTTSDTANLYYVK